MGPRELAKRILRSRGIIYKGSPVVIREIRRSLLTATDSNPKINVVFESVLENDSGLTVLKFMGAKGAIIGGSDLRYGYYGGSGNTGSAQEISTSIVELAAAGIGAQAALTTLIGQNLFGVTWC